ncbi:hypothetical protein L1887_00757 [Cichorium endivia]|nr:hypothetical protein L1887_00757 [Cichorium endivia]
MAPKRKLPHKHCGCENSKCLNLYCVCFAAQKYCTDDCLCEECFSRPEYQEKIKVAREEAEFRNPYAFSNKEGQEKNKIGCKCRVSMCTRQFCKCYKTEVGCRVECRCVGCKNVHGKREDNVDMMIGIGTTDQLDLMNQFTPQDINATHPSSVTNLPPPAESSKPHMMIITSTRDSDMVPMDHLDFMNQFTPQDFNARYDDMII